MTEDRPEVLSPFWRGIERYGIVVVVVAFYGMAALHFDYTPDDTYIYLQYAKHLAGGEGFSFNNESPSYGVTGPLWALMVAAGAFGGLDPYIVAKILDLVFASLAVLVLYVLASAFLRDRLYALCAASLLASDAWFLRWSASGMETSASVLLTLLAVLYVFRNEYLIASMVCGLLSLLRPEGILLFAVLQVDNFLNTTDAIPARRVFLRSSLLYALIVVPWIAFSWFSFGTMVPNTLGAKTFGEVTTGNFLYVLVSELQILGATQGLTGLILAAGLTLSLKRFGWKKVRLEIFPLFWVLGLSLFYIAANVQVVSRYLLLIIPFVILYGVWGFKRILDGWSVRPSKVRLGLVVLALASVLQNQLVYRLSVLPHIEGFTAGMSGCLKPMAYWLRENSPPAATVVTPDIGLLGYVSERELYDTAGLITPAMKEAFRGVSYEEGMMERRYEQVLHPHFVVDRSPIRERLASEDLVPVMTKEFPSLSIARKQPVFYTLYRMKQ